MSHRRKTWRTRQRRLQTSPWRVPLSYAAGALVASWVVPRLEVHVLPGFASNIGESAALAVYSSIASGMIALTGIVFSLTFVMVQFSATAYSPRLVLWLFRDPLISHALGMFMATFLYALAALSWVGRRTPTVPFISVIVVLLLLLASVCLFVGLIQRVALLQINRLLAFTGDQGRKVISALYAPFEAADSDGDSGDVRAMPPSQILSYQGQPVVVQAVHVE